MKKLFLAFILISSSAIAFSQRAKDSTIDMYKATPVHGFDKRNLFTGGDVELSFGTDEGIVGLNPMLGYSINNWLDAGVVFNFDYSWERFYDYTGLNWLSTNRQTVLGPGVFVKYYPIDFLFFQAQFEENFIRQKSVYPNGSLINIQNFTAPSLLLGIGYSGGREGKRSYYYYFSVSIDVAGNPNSPYLQQTLNPNGTISTSILPVIKAGLQIPLFQGKYGRY